MFEEQEESEHRWSTMNDGTSVVDEVDSLGQITEALLG